MALADRELIARILSAPLADLMAGARARRDARGPARMTYSPKVFIPLTRLCADVCHYCTFATTPSQLHAPYLTTDEVLEIARAGAAEGCKEALFTLGDAPERRYAAAREWLAERGFSRTIDYVRHCAELVLKETGLLPHVNAGVLEEDDYRMLRSVTASCGLMLESTSERLLEKGQAHHGSPDKVPAVRLASLEAAGRARMPMTSGILIGIGESPEERIESLIALRDVHLAHGHLQEVIVQNFCPKPGTKMAEAPEATEADFLRVIAAARIILPDEVSVQAPPNLNDERLVELVGAGIDDWGGISPVTRDHVNPEAPWPEIERLEAICAAAGLPLVERLTIYPRFVATDDLSWIDAKLRPAVLKLSDTEGLARDSLWSPGVSDRAPASPALPLGRRHDGPTTPALHRILDRAAGGHELAVKDIAALFATRGAQAQAVVEAADALRREARGETVTYVVNRNINYTNICTHSCSFLRLFEDQLQGRPSRQALQPRPRGDRQSRARGRGKGCDRSLPAGRHPSQLHRRHLCRHRACGEAGLPGPARPRVLAARSVAGRQDAGRFG